MTDFERDEALDLLRDPHLIERIQKHLEIMGTGGENGVQKSLFIWFATSRRARSKQTQPEHPLVLLIKGDSSAGKSYLLNSCRRTHARGRCF